MKSSSNTFSAEVKYRPVIIGWCILKNDINALLKSSNISYTLWGGINNPIIPIDEPNLADSLIKLFKVDILFNITEDPEVRKFIEKYNYLPWPFRDRRIADKKFAHPNCRFLDIEIPSKLYSDLKRKDLPFDAKKSITLIEIEENDDLRTLFELWFGNINNINNKLRYYKILEQYFDLNIIKIKPDEKIDFGILSNFRLSSLCSSQLKLFPPINNNIASVYLGDKENGMDLINFWNLRAANIPIVYLDKKNNSRLQSCIAEIKELFVHHNNRVLNKENMIGLYSSDNTDLAIEELNDVGIFNNNLSIYSWNGSNILPPIWYISNKTIQGSVYITDSYDKYFISLPEKKFNNNLDLSDEHFICDVKKFGHYNNSYRTISFPNIPELNTFIGGRVNSRWNQLRVGIDGVGCLIDSDEEIINLYSIPVDELIVHIFKEMNIEAEISKAGLITRRIIDQFEGLQGCRIFKIKGIRNLINSFKVEQSFKKQTAIQIICENSISRKTVEEFSEKYSDLHIGQKGMLFPDYAFSYLIENNAFQVGLELKCPTCSLISWIELDSIKNFSKCNYCGNEFNILNQLKNRDWAFRKSGIFGKDDNQEGAIPTLVTLQQLDTTIHSEIKILFPSLNLMIKGNKISMEIDLLFINQAYNKKTEVVLGECKTNKTIEKNDVDNLILLAEKFPIDRYKVYILFSKMSAFTKNEIQLCKKAQEGFDYRVIMLTDLELEPYFVYSKTEKRFPNINKYAINLYEMAENTFTMYFK